SFHSFLSLIYIILFFSFFFFLMILRPPISTLFPYTTLFRSFTSGLFQWKSGAGLFQKRFSQSPTMQALLIIFSLRKISSNEKNRSFYLRRRCSGNECLY